VFFASDKSAGVTGQALGLGGDKLALWSHPTEVAESFEDGGWSAEHIADMWAEKFAAQKQTSGIELPPLDLDGGS
jgi:3-oxoacyl-[acyl-carrier protein] reductase